MTWPLEKSTSFRQGHRAHHLALNGPNVVILEASAPTKTSTPQLKSLTGYWNMSQRLARSNKCRALTSPKTTRMSPPLSKGRASGKLCRHVQQSVQCMCLSAVQRKGMALCSEVMCRILFGTNVGICFLKE